MPEAAIELSGLTLSRGGRRVVDGLDLALGPAGVSVLMGPNGAGKSLTLRMIAGLIVPDRGRVSFTGGRPPPRDLALVFQTPVLLRRSVRGNLEHCLRNLGVPARQRPGRMQALLDMGGLSALAGRPARRLSGGEQQRLAVVRALAGTPRFLLLDEPTTSLDPQATQAIEGLIVQAVAGGTRVILVTHDRGQAARLADDIVFLNRGRLIEHSPADRFLTCPASAQARAYLAGELLV